MKFRTPISLSLLVAITLLGCSTFFKTEKMEEVKNHQEFEQLVEIKALEPTPEDVVSSSKDEEGSNKVEPQGNGKAQATSSVKKKSQAKSKSKNQLKVKKDSKMDKKHWPAKHLPEIEDPVGFDGRRPIDDPFVVGEKIVLELSYLNMTAGNLVFETKPFVEINGKKSYQFSLSIQSSKVFAFFYKLDNRAETYVDFENLTPYSHAVHIKESKQVKESRSFYDWEKGVGHYWENKVTDDGEKKKKKEWELVPYSQNLISALFYIRTFTLAPGKIIRYYVADADKQVTLKGSVLRKERIETAAGDFDTHVVKIEYTVGGTFQQIGEVLFWLTDDKYKHLVKIKSKIKIGSINGEVIKRIIK